MMNGCEARIDFTGDGSQALALVSNELEKLGYEEKKRDATELTMKFKGAWFTSDPSKMRHSVRVNPEAGVLCFKFGTGLVASHWTDSDRAWARSRAEDIVKAIQAST